MLMQLGNDYPFTGRSGGFLVRSDIFLARPDGFLASFFGNKSDFAACK